MDTKGASSIPGRSQGEQTLTPGICKPGKKQRGSLRTFSLLILFLNPLSPRLPLVSSTSPKKKSPGEGPGDVDRVRAGWDF